MPAQKLNECVEMTLIGAGTGTTYGLILTAIDWKRYKHRGGGVRQTTSGLLRMGGKLAVRNVMTWAPLSAMFLGLCCTMEKARGSDDWINVAIPGAIFGYARLGAMHRPGLAIINAAAIGTLLGVFDYGLDYFGKRG